MNKCLKPCSGLSLTSFVKYEPTNVFEKNYASTIDQYKDYKRMFRMDEDYKSIKISQKTNITARFF